MSANKQGNQIITYPIVVIESVWPKIPEEKPKIVGDGDSHNLIKVLSKSSSYSGYYRVIPLNILSISTNSSTDGHQFSIQFDPSYVYIEYDPKNFPTEIAQKIRNNSIPVDLLNQHTIVGVLETFNDNSATEKFITDFNTIASIVDELDTVTIFLLSEDDIFDFSQLLKVAGGSFSRIQRTQENENIKQLKALGLPEQPVFPDTIGKKVTIFRNFEYSLGLFKLFSISGLSYYFGENATAWKQRAKEQDIKTLKNFEEGKINYFKLMSVFPGKLAEDIANKRVNTRNLITEIENYYTTNKLANLLPFGHFFQVKETLKNVFGAENKVNSVALSVGIDLALAKLNPFLFSRMRNDGNEAVAVRQAVEFVSSVAGISLTVNDYLTGVETLISLANLKAENVAANVSAIFDSLTKTQIPLPDSSETAYLLLKGHITQIAELTSISETSGNRVITISGEGLEAPLKRHTVFFDAMSANRFLLALPTQYSILNMSPIDAANHIIETFMPDYVKIEELTQDDIHEAVQFLKDSNILIKGSGKKITKGALILPDPYVESDKSLVFAPIHFIGRNYLNYIKPSFDEIAIYERKVNVLEPVTESTVKNVLDRVLGKSSLYTWFVDEFGEIKVRFEPGQAITPTNYVISPPITDERLISIKTGIDESRIFTDVEVVPKLWSYASPSEGNLPGVFGRATAPSIASEIKDVYKKLEVSPKTKQLDDFSQWLSYLLTAFNKYVTKAWKELQKTYNTGISIQSVFNSKTPYEVVEALKSSGTESQKPIFVPQALSAIYKIVGIANSALIEEFSDRTENSMFYSPNGLLAFDLSAAFYSNKQITDDLFRGMAEAIKSSAPDWIRVKNVNKYVVKSWISLLATLSALGIKPNNVREYLNDKHVRNIINKSPVYVSVASVLGEEETYISTHPGREILPYTDLGVQEITPENTSPPLYKYGLRIHRASDAYLATQNLTKFRAEFLRRLHEDAIHVSSVSIVGSPLYKLGNTVLVVSENNEPLDSLIYESTLKTLEEFYGFDKLDLILGFNEILEGEKTKIPFTSKDITITKESLIQHFKSALRFILNESGDRSIPTSAYVPLFGIYNFELLPSNIADYVKTYLSLLVKAHLPENQTNNILREIKNGIFDALKNIAINVYGADLSPTAFNKISSFLRPQTEFAEQMYIKSISHSWSMTDMYTTSISLDYGRPVLLAKTLDNDIVGHLVIYSPISTYTKNGNKSQIIVDDNPLFVSLVSQVQSTKLYETSTLRYKIIKEIERIKRIRRKA